MWEISERILQRKRECRKLLEMKEKNVMEMYEERRDLGRKIVCLIYLDRCDGRVLPSHAATLGCWAMHRVVLLVQ
jgi:hypothetical protein